MRIVSSAFDEGSSIPPRFTCDGDDLSPPLDFSRVPDGCVSLALIVDDPDAPSRIFNHWLVWNLSPDIGGLAEDTSGDLDGAEGTNDFGETGYRGPCPPGERHRYRFTVFALDRDLPLRPGARRADLDRAMDGHVLDEARLAATYAR
jgi:Raf kinase inhibitor-like YbhB/YbcL family protein